LFIHRTGERGRDSSTFLQRELYVFINLRVLS